ncbi:MAG: PAS domain-containing protein, partial [Pseudomonadota bacterium]
MRKKTLTRWRLELVVLLLVALLPVSVLALYVLLGNAVSVWASLGLFLLMLVAGLVLAVGLAEKFFIAPFSTEVNQLQQTVAELEKSQLILRIAGRVARLGGWTIELPERKLTWSDENCLIHDVPPGYLPTLEEGIGYFLPEDRATVIKLVDACVQQGTPYEFVLPKMTAKGRRIWVRSIGEAVRDEAGNIIRIQGAFQDISAQKEAE